MARHTKRIPIGLDSRFPKEAAVLKHYDSVFDGRKTDFLRECVLAGYELLYGKVEEKAEPTLLGEIKHIKPAKPTIEVVEQETPPAVTENQDKPVDLTEHSSKPGRNLVGLLGNQL